MKYKYNIMTGQVTQNGVEISNDTLFLVTEMNKIEMKKQELAKKYTNLQEDYVRLKHDYEMLNSNIVISDNRDQNDAIKK